MHILQTYLEEQHLIWLYNYCILNQSVKLLAFTFQSQVDIFSILLSNFATVLMFTVMFALVLKITHSYVRDRNARCLCVQEKRTEE